MRLTLIFLAASLAVAAGQGGFFSRIRNFLRPKRQNQFRPPPPQPPQFRPNNNAGGFSPGFQQAAAPPPAAPPQAPPPPRFNSGFRNSNNGFRTNNNFRNNNNNGFRTNNGFNANNGFNVASSNVNAGNFAANSLPSVSKPKPSTPANFRKCHTEPDPTPNCRPREPNHFFQVYFTDMCLDQLLHLHCPAGKTILVDLQY